MSREERIVDLKIVDNVGMTDNVDLFALTDEEFSKLESEVFEYVSNRAEAWGRQFPKSNGKTEQENE